MALSQDELPQEMMEFGDGAGLPGILTVAWKHKFLLVLGGVVGFLLGYLYYLQIPPVYQSTAQVLVIKKKPDGLPFQSLEGQNSYWEDFLATHQVLIRSPLIVNQAVKKGQLAGLSSFGGQDDPTGSIMGNMTVAREMKDSYNATNILNLAFRGSQAQECGVVLNAIIDSYRDFLESTYRNVSKETVSFIDQAKEILETKLAQKEEDYRQFRLKDLFLVRSKEGTTIAQDRLTTLESKKSALLIRRTEVEGRLQSFQRAIKEGRSRAELLAMAAEGATSLLVGESTRANNAGPLEDPLVALQLQEQGLLEDFGPDHPQVRSLRKKMELLREPAKMLNRTDKEGEPLTQDRVKAYQMVLERELEYLQTMEKSLAKLLDSEMSEAKKQLIFQIQDDAYRAEIARHHQLFESVVKRLQEVNLIKDLGGYEAQSISPAGVGGKIAPRPFPMLVVALFFGLMGGLGLGYLAEVTDQSFHSTEEIRRRMGIPVVGHIPIFASAKGTAPADANAPDPSLRTHYFPQSLEAEAFRGVRTALYFTTRGEGHKVIQITSPQMGDGKSTLAANLAVSLAQSGKNVLLVDADFRRPRLQRIFRLEMPRGITSVINGETTLENVLQSSVVPGLSLLPCGPLPPNPAELLTGEKFKETLDQIRQLFDYVIVDTPPVLAVTDPCLVALQVDGVLLAVRLSKNARVQALKAREIMSTLGTKVIGVVVNGTFKESGSPYEYGYGKYYRDEKSEVA